MFHPWHDVQPGEQCPRLVEAIVVIPLGSALEYKLDRMTGMLRMDRVLDQSFPCPGNYGLVPQTWTEDEDPLDILVLCTESIAPMAMTLARPIGAITLVRDGKRDHQVIAVAMGDPEYNGYEEVHDLRSHARRKLNRFFREFMALEEEEAEDESFENAEFGRQVIQDAVTRYRETPIARGTPLAKKPLHSGPSPRAAADDGEGPHVTG